eukprot:UN23730
MISATKRYLNGPLEPQICGVVPNILHTHRVRFLRYLVFSKPCFFHVLAEKSTHVNIIFC